MNIGSSNKLKYDSCLGNKELYESTAPLAYNMYFGKFENCNKCKKDRFWVKYDLVDIESELRNQTRPLSNCDQFKYSPSCKKSKMCTSTFDKSVPVVLAPEICPIVYNNIPKMTTNGIRMPDQNFCKY